MKAKLVLFFSLLFLAALAQKPQSDSIPAVIQGSFEKEYPEARVKSWETKTDQYIASTKIEGQDARVFFTRKGEWIETIFAVSEKEFPGRITNYMNTNLPGYNILLSQYKESKNNGAFYYLQIKKAGSGSEIDAELFFDVSGTFIKQNEFHPLTEALSSSVRQEAEKKAKEEKENEEYRIKREALLKMDRTVAENDLPVKIKENFRKKFPKALETKWDSLDNIYNAYFKEGETPVRAGFSPEGDWLSTTVTLPEGSIYRPVDLYLEQNYAKYVVKLAESITKRDRNNYYYVEIHEKARKGVIPPVTRLYFDKSGRLEKAEEPAKEVAVVKDEAAESPDAPDNQVDKFEEKLKKEEQTKSKKKEVDPTALRITAKELPSPIVSYVDKTYPEYKIKEAFFSDYEDLGNAYKVTIKREGVNQPSSDLFFSETGNLLKEDNPPPKKKEAVKQEVTEPETAIAEEQEEKNEEKTVALTAEEAQLSDIPEVVKKKFTSRYPRASEASWTSEEGKFLVEFYLNEVKTILEYSADGVIQTTRTEMDPKTLFGPVQRYIDDNYKNYKVRYAEKIVRKDRKNFFYVEVFTKKKNVHPSEFQLYFDKAGKLMENPPE